MDAASPFRICSSRAKEKKGTTETWLPEFVISEILVRLPVKSLMRLKCVCTVWYKLISSLYFTTLYNTTCQSNKVKVSMFFDSYMRRDGSDETIISFRFFDVPYDLSIATTIEYLCLVGCSYGLVCLSLTSAHNRYVIWNPATKALRQINNPDFYVWPPAASGHSDYLCSGFCFDPIANSFKLARVSFTPTLNRSFMRGVVVQMFKSSSGLWTRSEIYFPCQFYKGGTITGTVSVARFIYWSIEIFDRRQGICELFILCFDLVNELFTRIEFPSDDCYTYDFVFTRYEETLALLVKKGTYPSKSIDAWVMNDFGGWSRLLTSVSIGYHTRPVGILSKDDFHWLVMDDFPDYSLYNPDTGETKAFSVVQRNFFLYCESLASV